MPTDAPSAFSGRTVTATFGVKETLGVIGAYVVVRTAYKLVRKQIEARSKK